MIIAFTGKKQTGKSTACSYIEEKYGFTRVNFKDALIAELKQNFPDLLQAILQKEFVQDIDVNIGHLFETKPPLIRTLMQNYGTNVRRKDSPYYWTRKWKDEIGRIKNFVDVTKNITVDDCRFLNEAQAVKDNGGIIIRLVRTDMEHTDTHQSETEMDSIVPDYTITCTGGDQEHLYTELDRILTELK